MFLSALIHSVKVTKLDLRLNSKIKLLFMKALTRHFVYTIVVVFLMPQFEIPVAAQVSPAQTSLTGEDDPCLRTQSCSLSLH